MTKGLHMPPRSDKVTGKRLQMCEDKGRDGEEVQEKHFCVTNAERVCKGIEWAAVCRWVVLRKTSRLHATDCFEIKTPASQGVHSLKHGYVNTLGHEGGLHNSCSAKHHYNAVHCTCLTISDISQCQRRGDFWVLL